MVKAFAFGRLQIRRGGQEMNANFVKFIFRKGRIFVFAFLMLLYLGASQTEAMAAKKSYINNANFQGTFTLTGTEAVFEEGAYEVVIDKITSKGNVVFQLHRGSAYYSRMSDTETIVARINNNKASFKFEDCSQGSKGKATIVFNKDKSIYLTAKVTQLPDWPVSYGLDIDKTKFKRATKKHQLS